MKHSSKKHETNVGSKREAGFKALRTKQGRKKQGRKRIAGK